MAESAGSSFEQILPCLQEPETLTGQDDIALETEHLEGPNQGYLGNTYWCSCGHCNAMSTVPLLPRDGLFETQTRAGATDTGLYHSEFSLQGCRAA